MSLCRAGLRKGLFVPNKGHNDTNTTRQARTSNLQGSSWFFLALALPLPDDGTWAGRRRKGRENPYCLAMPPALTCPFFSEPATPSLWRYPRSTAFFIRQESICASCEQRRCTDHPELSEGSRLCCCPEQFTRIWPGQPWLVCVQTIVSLSASLSMDPVFCQTSVILSLGTAFAHQDATEDGLRTR
jgi:hypothetical protein